MVNVGSLDRSLRFGAGIILLVAPFVPQLASLFAGLGDWKYAVSAAGVVLIGTAALRFCPAYTLLGVRTCSVERP